MKFLTRYVIQSKKRYEVLIRSTMRFNVLHTYPFIFFETLTFKSDDPVWEDHISFQFFKTCSK